VARAVYRRGIVAACALAAVTAGLWDQAPHFVDSRGGAQGGLDDLKLLDVVDGGDLRGCRLSTTGRSVCAEVPERRAGQVTGEPDNLADLPTGLSLGPSTDLKRGSSCAFLKTS
jgi:hypothetical protein